MMISNRVRAAGATLAIGLVGAVFYLGSAGQGFTPGVTMPMGCNAGESPQWDGAVWQCRTGNDYRGTEIDDVQEFLVTGGTVGNTVLGIYLTILTGTGASIPATSASGRPGIAQIITGTATTGSVRLQTSSTIALGSVASATNETTAGWPILSGATDEYADVIGLWDTGGVNQSNGCYFLYDRGNVAASGANAGNAQTLEVAAVKAGARTIVALDGTTQGGVTTVSTPVAALTLPNTNIYTLSVVGTSTQCVFKVNGAVVATLTTNIPTAALVSGVVHVKSAGTTSREIDVDRIHLHISLSAARSP